MGFAAGKNVQDSALTEYCGGGGGSVAVAVADADGVLLAGSGGFFVAAQDLLGGEEEELVVVPTCREELARAVPGYAADLLGVAAYAREERHAAVPVEEVALGLRGPFDAVEVDVAYLVADEEFFCVDVLAWIADGFTPGCGGSEADVRHWGWLFAVEARIAIQRAPQGDTPVCPANGEDGAAAGCGAERERGYVR